MAGIAYNDVELRKLPPRFRMKLAQMLDLGDAWKKLMATIPSELRPDQPKYTSEDINLVERYGLTNRKMCGEILLDEWSTSGRNRPKVEDLYELLKQCELFRAADFVAAEILDIPTPTRPNEGPAKVIPIAELNSQLSNSDNFNANFRETFCLNDEISTDPNLETIIDKLNNYDYQSTRTLLNFPVESLESATKQFDDSFRVGSGAFGIVYSLDLRPRGPRLAIKVLHPSSSVAEDQFVTEIQVLSKYKHENLVSLYGFSSNGPRFCLIYEFMPRGTLLEGLGCEKNYLPLNWYQRISIMFGVLNGMHYLHSGTDTPLIHRDLKSANILLNEQLMPKIADFGLAKSISNQTSALASTIFGTSAYMAPEAFRGDISVKMDVFSFGVIILEVLTGLPPYDENRDGNDIVTYLEDNVDDDNISPFLDDKAGIISSNHASTIYSISLKCLAEKRRRPNSEEVLQDFEPLLVHFNEKNFL